MKNLLLFFTSLIILAGCQQTPSNLCRVTGTILNPDSTVFMSYINRVRDTIDLNEGGAFTFEKESEKPMTIMFLYGRNSASVYIAPGKTVDFMVDVADWKNSQSFSGDLTQENNYILEKASLSREWQSKAKDKFVLEPMDYKMSRDSMQKVYNGLLDSYLADGISKSFADLERLTLEYGLYSDLNVYPRAYRYYAKKDTVILPDGWNNFKASLDFNNPLLIDVPAALNFISGEIEEGAMTEAGLSGDMWGKPELLIAKMDYIDKHIEIPEMKEYFTYDLLNQQMDAGPPTGIEGVIRGYLNTSLNEENKATVKEKSDAWSVILPGQPAPTFSLPNIHGENLALADLAGKYVYIDFWATWCGPCKAEFPHYRKLVADYKGRNVVFMSISVDKDKAAWKKMVEEEAFDWIQLHDSINMNDDYLVRYIPTFVFVNTEGKIITPRAPRPSDEALRAMLDAQPGL